MRRHDNISDDEIRSVARLAASRDHMTFVEVCQAALERSVLPGNHPTHTSRQRSAEALNTGSYTDLVTKDLPAAEQQRLVDAIGGGVLW